MDAAAAAAADDRAPAADPEPTYRTKLVEHFGRFVPIVLQNDNGPCPLIAICNVLLLKNLIQLSSEDSEVPLKKLLALVAERLLDSNADDQDAGYAKNQQRNIHDAIDMLPKLATGIDVNLHFRKIDDFEFTPERCLFDLLGINLYHGWIVDPQDVDTLNAIGTKSYNGITSEIVFLEQSNVNKQYKENFEEDDVDFVAATTATLGVPSPCFAMVKSVEDTSVPCVSSTKIRRGDREEEDELLRVLELSKADSSSLGHVTGNSMPDNGVVRSENSDSVLINGNNSMRALPTESDESDMSDGSAKNFSSSEESANGSLSSDSTERTSSSSTSVSGIDKKTHSLSTIAEETVDHVSDHMSQITLAEVEFRTEPVAVKVSDEWLMDRNENLIDNSSTLPLSLKSNFYTEVDNSSTLPLPLKSNSYTEVDNSSTLPLPLKSNSYTEVRDHNSVESSVYDPISKIDDSEPIYEGEETIIDSRNQIYENREPMYEGELILAEQADRESDMGLHHDSETKDEGQRKLSISAMEGELIQSFLRNNASQLTVYGLFCLQEGLKEQELCVFFRNNHFNTMFKFKGELYILVTDQGYLSQPDLVWEKFNEVTGDSIFFTGDFSVYKAEGQTSGQWDQQHAVASTTDWIDNVTAEGSVYDTDLQFAIDLQNKEFEQEASLRQPPRPSPPPAAGASGLVTGPHQGPRSHSAYTKPEGKSKEKCCMM